MRLKAQTSRLAIATLVIAILIAAAMITLRVTTKRPGSRAPEVEHAHSKDEDVTSASPPESGGERVDAATRAARPGLHAPLETGDETQTALLRESCVEQIGEAGSVETGVRLGGVREGLWRLYNADGSLWMEKDYHRGKLDGVLRIWRLDGRLSEVNEYRSGLLHGVATAYFPDGSVFRTATYEKGQQKGPWVEYSRTGSIASEGIAGGQAGQSTTEGAGGNVPK